MTSKENSNYNKTRLITFLIGLTVIIFSETTIRFISQMSIYNLVITVTPIVLLALLYLFLSNKFNIRMKNG